MLLCMQGVPSSTRRREMFSAYMEALRQVARERVVKAEKQLTDLLVKLNVGPESDWTEVSQILAAHPLAYAIPPERRAELFDARVRQVGQRQQPRDVDVQTDHVHATRLVQVSTNTYVIS